MSKALLEFDTLAPPVAPKDAATVIVARDSDAGPEVFCVERNKQSRFLGGAIVFPGGKLDPADFDDTWAERASPPRPAPETFAPDPGTLRALCVAALRETLEEAALLIARGTGFTYDDVLKLRDRILTDATFLPRFLNERSLKLDLGALHPLARWVTPEVETRRYDTRFFVTIAPDAQPGAHDCSETIASFWARPSELLARFNAGELQLAPPTHRTLEVLGRAENVAGILAIAGRARLAPICPKLISVASEGSKTLALTLPGDPEHPDREALVSGCSRYVLREAHWRPEPPPARSFDPAQRPSR